MITAARAGVGARRALAMGALLGCVLTVSACGSEAPGADAKRAPDRPSAATPPLEVSFEQVIDDTEEAVVRVLVSSCVGEGYGTGFKVGPRLVATAAHVVEGAEAVVLEDHTGAMTAANVIGFDRGQDLALLEAAGSLPGPNLRFSASGGARLGSEVVALGFPLDLPLTITRGTVSGLGRSVPVDEQTLIGLMQTDAAVNPGNSGGPLVERSGKVVGVVVAGGIMAQSIGFGVPAGDAHGAIERWRHSPDARGVLAACVPVSYDESYDDEPYYEDPYQEEPEYEDPVYEDPVYEDPEGPAPSTSAGFSPDAVILQHWEAISSGDYEKAFSLFAPSYRSANSSWIDVKLATLPNVDLASLAVTSGGESAGAATVHLDLVAADTSGSDAGVCRNFVGQVTLRAVDGDWLYEPGTTLDSVPIDPGDDRCLRVT